MVVEVVTQIGTIDTLLKTRLAAADGRHLPPCQTGVIGRA